MVLVLVGTQKQDFSRLFREIENAASLKDEKIVAQSGHTKYKSNKIECIPFMNREELIKLIKKADFIICHGGVGTIFDSLYEKKKILAVPRLKKYGEHVNDHQIEVCSKLQDEGYILYFLDGENFDDKIKLLKNTKFKEYKNNNKFIEVLKNEI